MKSTWRDRVNNTKSGKFNPLLRVVFVLAVALLAIGSYHIYKFIWPTPYVAKQSGFQIVFPGVPTVKKLPPQKESGVEVSGTIYSLDNQTKGTDYAVYVTNYPHADFTAYSQDSKIGTLEAEVSTIAQNDQLSLSDGQTTTLDGETAVEATLSPSDHSEPNTYAIATLSQNRLYMLLGAGISKSQFNSYIKTFHFVR